jgi:hypothetical protein
VTPQDKPAFATMMVATGELFNRTLSPLVLEMQYTVLADLELEDIQRAVTAHVRTKTFFPTPAEIREAINGSAEDRAELAWVAVQRLVRSHGWANPPKPEMWPNEATRRAAMELYGGWTALCENLPAGGPEMLGTAKLFKACFAAYARRDDRAVALLPGKDDARKALSNLKQELAARGLPAGKL